jgi:hypothetical protein
MNQSFRENYGEPPIRAELAEPPRPLREPLLSRWQAAFFIAVAVAIVILTGVFVGVLVFVRTLLSL